MERSMSTSLRIGQGYDVHAFTSGDHVMLGGERVPHSHGVLAHSDGDVLLHAICDGFRAVNVDATVIAERPRLGRYREAMRTNIGSDLGLDPARVNVKATTTESLGFVGRGEGLACQAVVLIEQTTGRQVP
jgi:2-C-methyl-D-erythritol 2,4-cyclodiphosphate synthase